MKRNCHRRKPTIGLTVRPTVGFQLCIGKNYLLPYKMCIIWMSTYKLPLS